MNIEKLEYAKQDYLKLKESEGSSNKTIKKYETVINTFYWDGIINYETFMNRFNDLFGSKAKKTQSDYYTILKNFSKFLRDKGILEFWLSQKNPIKVGRKPVEFLTKKEVDVVRKYLKDNCNIEEIYIFELFLQTGIRLEEFDKVNSMDLFLKQDVKKILIIGKGGHSRYIYIPNQLKKITDEIGKDIKIRIGLRTWKNKKPISYTRDQIGYFFRKLSKATGIKITPHKLRRTFATNLSMRGANIAAISHLLGHSDIKITTDYIATPEIFAQATINLYMNEFDDSYAQMNCKEKNKYLENKIKILQLEKEGII